MHFLTRWVTAFAVAVMLLVFVPAPALADKAADAKWILDHQDRYTPDQIIWAKSYLAITPAPAPVPTPKPAPIGTAIAGNDALARALAAAKGGETFLLADAGSYSITLNGKAFAKPVTITSAAGKLAKVGYIKFTNASNIVLTRLELGRSATVAAREGTFMVTISGGSDVTIDGNYIHGSLDGKAVRPPRIQRRSPPASRWGCLHDNNGR